jgi:hypothetical protein
MNADLLTALLRATNDGVVPRPLAGEDMDAYRFRAACAGAVVAATWAARQAKEAAQAKLDEQGAEHDGGQEGRPGDVTVTSPLSQDNPVKFAAFNGGLREIGVD